MQIFTKNVQVGLCKYALTTVVDIAEYSRSNQWRSQEFDWGVNLYVLTSHRTFKTCVNVFNA